MIKTKQKKRKSTALTMPAQKSAKRPRPKKKTTRLSVSTLPFKKGLRSLQTPIVAVGASAGGLEALEALFNTIPDNPEIAFVVIVHLDPKHSSLLPELLQKTTKLKVLQITHEIPVEPNYIYVISPNRNIVIRENTLKLVDCPGNTRNRVLPIDLFFQSLAEEPRRKIIGIILSGTGMDGTQGIRAISAAGGLVIVQDPSTAKYDGMPAHAIDTGLVDHILPPDKMSEHILQYISYSYSLTKAIPDERKAVKELQPIYHLLRTHIGHDFSSYKHNTICRRIEKRMSIHQVNDIATYTRYLQHNPSEIQVLFKDLLIGVTNFFRNPEAFESLRQILLTNTLKTKPKEQDVRVWVPACATGEEVYSIAILLQECMEELKTYFNVQIFGTDIDEAAIETARLGLYPATITADVSKQRLQRFFTLEEGLYRINKEIRKMVVFAPQNITRDPPFTKLDLLSCRNLLIYLTTELQKKLLPLFHYSLNYNGILFLGSAENIGGFGDLFKVVDKKWKIFERKEGLSAFTGPLYLGTSMAIEKMPVANNLAAIPQKPKEANIAHLVETILLENYAPACIVLDEKEDIVYIYGRTGKYLEPATGLANLNILHMARPGLRLKLAAALRSVASQKKQVFYKNLQISTHRNLQYVNFKVRPFRELDPNSQWKLIIIEDVTPPEIVPHAKAKRSSTDQLIKQINSLEEELKQSKENLQTTIEELETSNEELKSSNEELQSTNEELQSTNEELETSKEELQSLNEELTTVNSELEARIEELSSANDDIQNLLYGTEIATLFLDNQLHIKRFTPKATELMNLIQTDIGRPITDIVSKLKYETLVEDARKVVDTLHSMTIEVQNKEGQWFQVRIIPYRTLTNLIDGVVITFLNITAQKQAEERVKQFDGAMQDVHNYVVSMMDTVHEALLVLNKNLRIVAANTAFYKTFQTEIDKVHDLSIYTFWEGKVPAHALQQLFEKHLKNTDDYCGFSVPYLFKKNTSQKMLINAKRIHYPQVNEPQILLAVTFDGRIGEKPHD